TPSSRPVPPTQTPEQGPNTRLGVAAPAPRARRLRVAPPRRTTGTRAAPSPRRHPPFARRCTATSRPASSVDCASAAAPRTPQVRIDAIPGGRARAAVPPAPPSTRSNPPQRAAAAVPPSSHAAPAPHPLPTKSHPFRRPIKRPLAHAAQTPATRRRCPSRPPTSSRRG
ncbi:hypothetical protein B0H15DRAFT_852629, partial [Mycena belliarum]